MYTLTITDNLHLDAPPLLELTGALGFLLDTYNHLSREVATHNENDPFIATTAQDAKVTVDATSGALTSLTFTITDANQHSLTVTIEAVDDVD